MGLEKEGEMLLSLALWGLGELFPKFAAKRKETERSSIKTPGIDVEF